MGFMRKNMRFEAAWIVNLGSGAPSFGKELEIWYAAAPTPYNAEGAPSGRH
jgi:hypothetical protein